MRAWENLIYNLVSAELLNGKQNWKNTSTAFVIYVFDANFISCFTRKIEKLCLLFSARILFFELVDDLLISSGIFAIQG